MLDDVVNVAGAEKFPEGGKVNDGSAVDVGVKKFSSCENKFCKRVIEESVGGSSNARVSAPLANISSSVFK